MRFPCHAVPLRIYIVSFPFDLRSTAVFDSHVSCRSYAVPLPCHEYAVLKATSQSHGRFAAGSRQVNDMGTAWYVLISIGRLETACGRPARVRHCRRMAR
jgi:hypothetical protein